jgi:hypothetical protein
MEIIQARAHQGAIAQPNRCPSGPCRPGDDADVGPRPPLTREFPVDQHVNTHVAQQSEARCLPEGLMDV